MNEPKFKKIKIAAITIEGLKLHICDAETGESIIFESPLGGMAQWRWEMLHNGQNNPGECSIALVLERIPLNLDEAAIPLPAFHTRGHGPHSGDIERAQQADENGVWQDKVNNEVIIHGVDSYGGSLCGAGWTKGHGAAERGEELTCKQCLTLAGK